ncbi:MAG: HTH-type transcriptional regulator, sugar sensing transcriptional regulator [Methanolobus sp.]|jgi:sugar-specific transcriptional regulator TrmB|uniref:TrmB family transcriptional regulator n=1 Tax=Methanolobus sp. TaxID=1874737 RepID=UPI0025880EE3|nr:helix-turn-helix domain-containing protein [Methanolobus sp.]MDK2831369.1 HTH-type transcriptional regulator, sugar sensing transcriptional regulator [Methanolobus sp.]
MLENKLIKLGLNKYEVDAYLYVLKHGIAEAGAVHKETNIPYGKIYETMNSLVTKGLFEVQNSRPKKYMAKKPSNALNGLYAEKKKQVDEDLENTRKLIIDIGKEIDEIKTQKPAERSFWITAMGNEIPEMTKSNFEEAEKEICILLYLPKTAASGFHSHSDETNESETRQEMMKAFERGVKLRMLSSKETGMMHTVDDESYGINDTSWNIEIRYQDEPFPAYFTIIDNDKVVFSIIDPVEQNNVIAMTKVWDQRLASKLQGKFEEMWKSAKKLH